VSTLLLIQIRPTTLSLWHSCSFLHDFFDSSCRRQQDLIEKLFRLTDYDDLGLLLNDIPNGRNFHTTGYRGFADRLSDFIDLTQFIKRIDAGRLNIKCCVNTQKIRSQLLDLRCS
jgi:hypothetical protein